MNKRKIISSSMDRLEQEFKNKPKLENNLKETIAKGMIKNERVNVNEIHSLEENGYLLGWAGYNTAEPVT